MRMYHGSSNQVLTLHEGLCLTPSEDAARDYAKYAFENKVLHAAEIDLTGLTVLELDGYDHDENTAPGDDGQDYGADILIYADESPFARQHETWRLMTPAALAVVAYASSSDAEEW